MFSICYVPFVGCGAVCADDKFSKAFKVMSCPSFYFCASCAAAGFQIRKFFWIEHGWLLWMCDFASNILMFWVVSGTAKLRQRMFLLS